MHYRACGNFKNQVCVNLLSGALAWLDAHILMQRGTDPVTVRTTHIQFNSKLLSRRAITQAFTEPHRASPYSVKGGRSLPERFPANPELLHELDRLTLLPSIQSADREGTGPFFAS